MELLDYIFTAGNGKGSGNCSGNGFGFGDGSGKGNGEGGGNGFGYGNGEGSGNGEGNGFGFGFGNGFGNGSGNGITEFEGVIGYKIDGITTFLVSIKHNVGKGFTLNNNVIKVPCWVYLTDDGYIAHGETLHDAMEAAVDKFIQAKPLDERISDFVDTHTDIDNEYDDLFKWHNILTGSCEFGRKQWCEAHGLKPTDSITIRRFIEETKNEYGGDVIRKVEEMYKK